MRRAAGRMSAAGVCLIAAFCAGGCIEPLYGPSPQQRRRESDRAIAKWTKAIERRPDSAEAYYFRGAAYRKKGDHNRAIADCTKAIELEPDYAIAYNNRGFAYAQKGDHDHAIADYTKAVELKPDFAEAYNNRGLAYGGKGDHNRAMADYTKAIELRRDYAIAYRNRGLAYSRKKGDLDRAREDLEKAVALDPLGKIGRRAKQGLLDLQKKRR